jgi:Zn-dependent peptidase ImmA (M78 family)
LEILASLNGVRIENVETLGEARDASYSPGVILVSRRSPPKRRRYSIAHELVHHLVPVAGPNGSVADLPLADQQKAHHEIELLCQVIAAELLLPAVSVREHLPPPPLAFAHVAGLAELFDCSIEAAARRCTDLSEEPVGLIVCRPAGDVIATQEGRDRRGKPRLPAKDDDLVVTAFIAPPGFANDRMRVGEPIPRRSVIRKAWGWAGYRPREGRIYSAHETWPEYANLGTVFVEAVALPRRKKPIEVLALLRRSDGAA